MQNPRVFQAKILQLEEEIASTENLITASRDLHIKQALENALQHLHAMLLIYRKTAKFVLASVETTEASALTP